MAQRLAGLFFCPMRASPANRISMSRAISIQARANFMDRLAPPSGVVISPEPQTGGTNVARPKWTDSLECREAAPPAFIPLRAMPKLRAMIGQTDFCRAIVRLRCETQARVPVSTSPAATANDDAPMVISAMNGHAAMVISATHADGAVRPNATGAVKSPGAYDGVGVGRRQGQAGDEHAKSQSHHRYESHCKPPRFKPISVMAVQRGL
jgi:hypothetical protein